MMYSESSQPWFFWLLAVILVLFGGWYALALFNDPTIMIDGHWTVVIVSIFVFSFLIIMTCASFSYMVIFDGQTLTVGFLGWKVRLSAEEIISAEEKNIRWLKWGGMGWRVQRFKKIGYIVKSGRGVEVQSSRKGRSYTFNCRDPAALLAALKRANVNIIE